MRLDLATRFSGLRLDENLTGTDALPPLSGLAARWVDEAGAGLRGRSGTIRSIAVSFDEDTGATVTGPVSVDEDGLIDAELEVTLRNPRALAPILGDLMPEARRELELGFAAMGDASTTLPLRIDKGRVRLGFLSLGRIPPL